MRPQTRMPRQHRQAHKKIAHAAGPSPALCAAHALQIDIMESINAMTSITHGIHYGGPYPTANVMVCAHRSRE